MAKKKLTESDTALWEHVTRNVIPLETSKKPIYMVQEDENIDNVSIKKYDTDLLAVKMKREKKAALQAADVLFSSSAPDVSQPKADRSYNVQWAPLEIGQTAGLDRRTSDRFTKGKMLIEARLDLHGMIQTTAYPALVSFINRSWAAHLRCVLVITGKGLSDTNTGPFILAGASPSRKGILRQLVPQWLNEPALRNKILKISHARPNDGGSGALYILLRRQR